MLCSNVCSATLCLYIEQDLKGVVFAQGLAAIYMLSVNNQIWSTQQVITAEHIRTGQLTYICGLQPPSCLGIQFSVAGYPCTRKGLHMYICQPQHVLKLKVLHQTC